MKNYTGFIYLWRNTKNNKFYIGSHYGSTDDNYIGSGIHFYRAYEKDPTIFIRKIIYYHTGTRDELLKLEARYLKKYNVCENPKFYNLTNKAGGGYNINHLSKEERHNLHKKIGALNAQRIKNMTHEEKHIMRKKKQESWKISPKRKIHSKRTSKRRIKEESAKTEQEKAFESKICKDRYWNRSEQEIKRQHKKQSEGVKKWHENMPDDLKRQRIEKMNYIRE